MVKFGPRSKSLPMKGYEVFLKVKKQTRLGPEMKTIANKVIQSKCI